MGRLWKSRGLHGRGRGLAGGRPGGGGADKAAIIQGKSPVPNTTPLRPIPSASPGSRATSPPLHPPQLLSPALLHASLSPFSTRICAGGQSTRAPCSLEALLCLPPSPHLHPKLSDPYPAADSALLQLCTSALCSCSAGPGGLHTSAHPTQAPPSLSPRHQSPQHPHSHPPTPAMPSALSMPPSCLWLRAEAATPQKPFPSQMDSMIHRK